MSICRDIVGRLRREPCGSAQGRSRSAACDYRSRKFGNCARGSVVLMVRLSMSKTIFWASALCAVAAVPMLADQWSKSFSVGAAPELRIETSAANLTRRAADVKTITARGHTHTRIHAPGHVHR